MSDYSGFGSGSSGNLQSADRGRLMEQVRSQIAVASAQELIQVLVIHALVLCLYLHVQ